MTVEAEIDNSSGALKPGQFATVRILQERAEPAVFVPARAVVSEAGVSACSLSRTAMPNSVSFRLGQTEGDLVEIKNGVAADEQVATSGMERLSDGVAVKQ